MRPVRPLLLMLAALTLVACSDRSTTPLADATVASDAPVGTDTSSDGPAPADAARDGATPTPDSTPPTPDVSNTDTVAPCGKVQTDSFKQQLNRKVDILFVIDSSGSMMDDKPKLVATAPAFAAAAAAHKLDFQLGSVGMSKPYSGAFTLGKLHGDPRYITKTTPDLQGEFKERIDLPSGGGAEIGFDAVVAALSPALSATVNASSCTPCAAPNICVAGGCRGPNWGFRRAGASLELLFFTDEDDGSTATTPAQVLAALKAQVTPKQGQFVRVHGLLPLGSCAGAGAYPRWKGLVTATGGKLHDLCAASYSAAIKDLTDRVFGLQDQFFLSQPPKAGTIKVLVGGKATTAFTHDASSNSVTLATPPADGVSVAISYAVTCP